MELEHNWFQREYENKEEKNYHRAYEIELYFYQAIANGDVEYINKVSSEEHFDELKGLGNLSSNTMKNFQFHYVISVALVTRTCIEAGMPLEEGFSLSDFYIQQLDMCTKPSEINTLTYQMNMDFTKRMQILKNLNGYSNTVQKCFNYIYKHLHGRITVAELANYVNLNRSHLSRLFKSETSQTIQEYILNQKIQESKTMLKFFDYTSSEIAHNLGFSSQSHFTRIFKLHTGMTPKEYQKLYYGKSYYL